MVGSLAIVADSDVAVLVVGVFAATVNEDPRSVGEGNDSQVSIHHLG